MAKIIRIGKEVPGVFPTLMPTVTIELTPHEVHTLLIVGGHVGGDPKHSARKYIGTLTDTLWAYIRDNTNITNIAKPMVVVGSITFKGLKK